MINTFMFTCKYFSIQELVSPQTYQDRGSRAWQLFDDRLLVTIDRLRERYGRATINSWAYGGAREWSGLRTPESPYYSKYSQHSYGRAVDIIFQDVTAQAVRFDIMNQPNSWDFEFITTLETDVSWLHLDLRNIDRIYTFKP